MKPRPDCPSCTGNIDAALCESCAYEIHGMPLLWDEYDRLEDAYGYDRMDLMFGGNW